MSDSQNSRSRRVVLHIGTAKTGTTSIQAFLVRNSGALARKGILVPASALLEGRKGKSHRKLAEYARESQGDAAATTARAERGVRGAFAQEFEAECRGSPAQTVILSSEHLSSRLHRPEEIGRLKTLLDRIGTTTVVIYLRRQEDYLVSAYSTAVRLGATQPLQVPSSRVIRNRFDYRALCERWAKSFGVENVKVAVFESRRFNAPEDLIVDFARIANLAITVDQFELPPHLNQSLDWRMQEFLRRFNAVGSEASRREIRAMPYRDRLLKLLTQLPQRERVTLPRDDLRRFVALFADGNTFVAKNYLGREDGVLFPPTKNNGALGYTDEMPIEIGFRLFAIVWAELQEKGAGAAMLEKLDWPNG